MDLAAATIEQLEADGTMRTLLLAPRPGQRLVVALPDEYDEPRDGPLHFLDPEDAERYTQAFASGRIRQVGPKRLHRDGSQLRVTLEWRGIRGNEGLVLYTLSLPRDAVINSLSITDPRRANAARQRCVLRDDARHRFVIYMEAVGLLDFDLRCDLTVSPGSFATATYTDTETRPGSLAAAGAWQLYVRPEDASTSDGFFSAHEVARATPGVGSTTPSAPRSPGVAKSLRILHLSDLHERAPFEGIPQSRQDLLGWDAEERGQVLGPRFSEALTQIAREGVDLVCFTGDLADWGRPEEYSAATRRLAAVLDEVQVPRERFFAVPGNHDVRRTLNEDSWRGVREWHARTHDGAWLGRWFRNVGTAPPGMEAGWREEVLQRTNAFWDWLDEFGRPDLRPRAPRHLGYRFSLPEGSLPGIGVPIHIIGLDSAWLCGDDHDQGRILVTEEQVQAHIRDREDALAGLRVALVHHPLDHLADHNRVRRLLADGGVDLLLHGHQHEPLALESVESGGHLRVFASGCLFEGEHGKNWPNGFQLIQVDVSSSSSSPSGTVHFRKWSKDGRFWAKGSDIYRDAPDGTLRWPLTRLADASPPISPLAPTATTHSVGEQWRVVFEGTVGDLTAIDLHELLVSLRRVAKDAKLSIVSLGPGSIVVDCEATGSALLDAHRRGEFLHAYGFTVLAVSPSREEGPGLPEFVRQCLQRELLEPSAHHGTDRSAGSLSNRVGELVKRGEVSRHLATEVREGLDRGDLWESLRLASEVRLARLTSFLEADFAHHLIWHGAQVPRAQEGSLFAALAVVAPDFDYEYRVFERAARAFNDEGKRSFGLSAPLVPVPSVSTFARVLAFRASELDRVERSGPGEWRWPEEWGDIHFNGPVGPGHIRNRDRREDRERLGRALLRYESGRSDPGDGVERS